MSSCADLYLFFTFHYHLCVETSWSNENNITLNSCPLIYTADYTYSTLVDSGTSSDAGALSSPMLEQLTTQDGWSPASAQLQLTGQGLQLLPPSPCGPEPHASKQQRATSSAEKKLNLGTQTPCFRLDKVCPFPQGIAHSHLIASDGASPLSLGRNTIHSSDTLARPFLAALM